MATFQIPKTRCSRVVVLAGGDSPERLVSLNGGRAVSAALISRGFKAVWLDPAEQPVATFPWRRGDVAFLVLHGQFGEDGQVQKLLAQRGIPYTGSDAAASEIAFSKSSSKERFRQNDVPTPASVVIHQTDSPQLLRQRAIALGFPLVVKPDTQGSSLGVSVAFDETQLAPALERCFALDAFGLLESYVVGTEWTVGLWDDRALPAICIDTPRGFYDYQAKYEDDQTLYHFEPAVSKAVLQQVQEVAGRAGAALGTRGIARVDLRLDADHRPWVLEVNTIPGMTDHSLIPKAAARLGISFPDLCAQVVEDTLTATQLRRAA